MTVSIGDSTYHQTAEACRIAGISKATYFRWLRQGVLPDVASRDRRGWRVFSSSDLKRLVYEAQRVTHVGGGGNNGH
jgi:predicted site-specific integrase-resolvase